MYFPYLITKSEEINAIEQTVCCYDDNCIIPILKPYSEDDEEQYVNKSLKKAIKILLRSKKKFIILVDKVSDLSSYCNEYGFDVFNNYCIYGFNCGNSNYSKDVKVAIFHDNINNEIFDDKNILYHIFMPQVLQFKSYISQYGATNKIVVIEDAFNRKDSNAEYPKEDLFNSELCFTFDSPIYKYYGYGDFTILPKDYTPSQGVNQNNITHVIHLIREDNKVLKVRHYLTTPYDEPENVLRSIQTLKKASADKTDFIHTKGIELIQEYSMKSKSTSLGMYKRIGMMHHIDFMHKTLCKKI